LVSHWPAMLFSGIALHIVIAQRAGAKPNSETGCAPVKPSNPSPPGGRFDVRSLLKRPATSAGRSDSFSFTSADDVQDASFIRRSQSTDQLPGHDSMDNSKRLFLMKHLSLYPLEGKAPVLWLQKPRFLNTNVQLSSEDEWPDSESGASGAESDRGGGCSAMDAGRFRWRRRRREEPVEARVGKAVKVLSRTMPRSRKEWCIWLAPHLKWWAQIAQCANDIANGRHKHSRIYMWSCVGTAVVLELWAVYLSLEAFAIAIGVFFLLLQSPVAASFRGIAAYARWWRLGKGPPAAWQMKLEGD